MNKKICISNNSKKFDAVFLERPFEEGLKKEEIVKLMELLAPGEMIPLELPIMPDSANSQAMGFISLDAADKLDFDYTNLSREVARILNNMNEESSDGNYSVDGFSFYLNRNF